jgi:probable HAF family extracellular repeat protein
MSRHVDALERRTMFAYAVIDLGTLGGGSAMAHDISDTGYVVGEARTGRRQTHAFRWFGGRMKDLGALGGQGIARDDKNEAGVLGRAGDPMREA